MNLLNLLKRFCRVLVMATAMVCVAAIVEADVMLDPKSYVSSSGQFELSVDPTSMDGAGPADYQLSKAGIEVWSKRLSFSLWEARVTNTGAVVGYSYERGCSFGRHGAGVSGLAIYVLDSDGVVLLRDPWESHGLDAVVHNWGGDSPWVLGILVDEESDRFIARIPVSGSYKVGVWWTYRISTGDKLSDTVPFSEEVNGWRVDEVLQESVADEELEPVKSNLIELEYLGTIEFGQRGKRAPAIARVYDFSIDPAGVLGFVGHRGDGKPRLVRVDPRGEILTEMVLDFPPDEDAGSPRVGPVSEERWIVIRSGYGEEPKTRAWSIDIRTSELSTIEGYLSGPVESVTPIREGGLFTLSARGPRWFSADLINLFDRHGSWLGNGPKLEFPEGYGFESAAWLDDNRIAALVQSPTERVDLFDSYGALIRSLDLEEVIGHEPNLVTRVTADRGGGFVLHDFNGSPTIYRIDINDNVTARFTPRFEDGRIFRISGGVQVAPDGSMWTSDGHSLLRLDENGVVDRVLGRTPDDDDLEAVSALAVGPSRKIYALNERTASVHVFDDRGTLTGICKPLPNDFPANGGFGSIAVDGEGSIFFHNGSHFGAGYLGFTDQFERTGFRDHDLSSIQESWFFKPQSRETWVLAYRSVHLVGSDGEVKRTIDRRPNRKWLRRVHGGAVAPDGSLAVVASPVATMSSEPSVVCVYGPTGDPICMIPLAPDIKHPRLAFDGTTVAIAADGSVYLHDLKGGARRECVFPTMSKENRWWYPHFSPDGSELWLHRWREPALHRYKLP